MNIFFHHIHNSRLAIMIKLIKGHFPDPQMVAFDIVHGGGNEQLRRRHVPIIAFSFLFLPLGEFWLSGDPRQCF